MGDTIVLSEDKKVYRHANTVQRPIKPWSKSMHRFLGFLEERGLPVEHILGTANEDVAVYQFIEGEMVHPYKWTDEALYKIGELVAQLHACASDFTMLDSDVWQPWCLREIGSDKRICCHGDIAPWNIITKNGLPRAIVDWEFSGLLDPMVELARVCWLFPQLVDDDLQKIYDLPSPQKRAEQVRIICDGYGLSKDKRQLLTNQMIEVIICETAHEAIDTNLKFDDSGCLWGFAWRTRSLYWVWRNKDTIDRALE